MKTQHEIGLNSTTCMYIQTCTDTHLRDTLMLSFPLFGHCHHLFRTIQPLSEIHCNLGRQIKAWSVGQPQAQSSHKILFSTYHMQRVMISGKLKHKSRSLPLLALKDVKIELGKEVIPLHVPHAYKTINDNSKRNDTAQ